MGVDPLRHEISRVGHRPNAAPLGWVRSKSHLKREVFGGPTETLSLFPSKLVHDLLCEAVTSRSESANWIFPFIEHLPEWRKAL